jgi:hypothetical protein
MRRIYRRTVNPVLRVNTLALVVRTMRNHFS